MRTKFSAVVLNLALSGAVLLNAVVFVAGEYWQYREHRLPVIAGDSTHLSLKPGGDVWKPAKADKGSVADAILSSFLLGLNSYSGSVRPALLRYRLEEDRDTGKFRTEKISPTYNTSLGKAFLRGLYADMPDGISPSYSKS